MAGAAGESSGAGSRPAGGSGAATPPGAGAGAGDAPSGAGAPPSGRRVPSGAGVGDSILTIEGKDLDGEEFTLDDYAGKVMMIDFWGDW